VASRLEDLELVLGEAARREQGEEDDPSPDTVKVRDSNPQGADPPPPPDPK
jgi:hypothetical protein